MSNIRSEFVLESFRCFRSATFDIVRLQIFALFRIDRSAPVFLYAYSFTLPRPPSESRLTPTKYGGRETLNYTFGREKTDFENPISFLHFHNCLPRPASSFGLCVRKKKKKNHGHAIKSFARPRRTCPQNRFICSQFVRKRPRIREKRFSPFSACTAHVRTPYGLRSVRVDERSS